MPSTCHGALQGLAMDSGHHCVKALFLHAASRRFNFQAPLPLQRHDALCLLGMGACPTWAIHCGRISLAIACPMVCLRLCRETCTFQRQFDRIKAQTWLPASSNQAFRWMWQGHAAWPTGCALLQFTNHCTAVMNECNCCDSLGRVPLGFLALVHLRCHPSKGQKAPTPVAGRAGQHPPDRGSANSLSQRKEARHQLHRRMQDT